jgi:streptogramin lyase
MTPDGKISEYRIPSGVPFGIARSSAGEIWVSAPKDHLLYRVDAGGNFSITRLEENLMPGFMTAAPDGSVYFSDPYGRIGRITASGEINDFVVTK